MHCNIFDEFTEAHENKIKGNINNSIMDLNALTTYLDISTDTLTAEQYITFDDATETSEQFLLEDILEKQNTRVHKEKEDDDDNDIAESPKITFEQSRECMKTLNLFFEQNSGDFNHESFEIIRILNLKITEISLNHLKQSKITDFFTWSILKNIL